jgi:DNA-binding Lrp family transcriptional regulator
MAVDRWWSDIDDAVLACLSETGGASPAEIGRRLGMSEEAAASLVSMLAQEGRVRISRVEAMQGVATRRAGRRGP